MDKDYEFEIEPHKEFKELELLEETKAILANIFRDYWTTPYQRERIIAKEQQIGKSTINTSVHNKDIAYQKVVNKIHERNNPEQEHKRR